MNHQPFETWIFMQEELSDAEAASLQEHLHTCDPCHGLAAAWRQVEPVIQTAGVVAPAPGFINRWQLRLEKERLALQRRQSLLVFGFGMGAALFFLILLAVTILTTINSPVDWFLMIASRLAALFLLADVFQDAFSILSSAVPISWLAAGGVIVAALCLLWIFSLQRLAQSGRVSS